MQRFCSHSLAYDSVGGNRSIQSRIVHGLPDGHATPHLGVNLIGVPFGIQSSDHVPCQPQLFLEQLCASGEPLVYRHQLSLFRLATLNRPLKFSYPSCSFHDSIVTQVEKIGRLRPIQFPEIVRQNNLISWEVDYGPTSAESGVDCLTSFCWLF